MALDSSKALQTVGVYDIVDKIADGGMGSVYRAKHRQTGEVVAIKVIPPQLTKNQILLKRFEQEFRAASRLDHPNIVRALDFGEVNGSPYLAMEYVDGDSLGARIERDGAIPEAEAIRLIAQVARGLHRAHKLGMIHRDVKPDNVLVNAEGVAKLADMGLVKELDADLNLTRTGRGLGTPHFMAPEQFRNAKHADERCDIYSLAATLYQMVTGELPFKANGPLDAWMKKINNELTPPRQLAPTLSERTDWAIRRAMSPHPEERPLSCREFVEDLTGHSTRKTGVAESVSEVGERWYLTYQDEDNKSHLVKGSLNSIRRSLKDGLLGDASNVQAGRSKAGPFEPLRNFPEFRDLVIAPGTKSSASVVPGPQPTEDPVPPRAETASPTSTPIPPTPSKSPAPKLQLEPPTRPQRRAPASSTGRGEWILWIAVFLVALVTGIVAFYVLDPK